MEYPVAQGIGIHVAAEEDPVPLFLDHPAGDPAEGVFSTIMPLVATMTAGSLRRDWMERSSRYPRTEKRSKLRIEAEARRYAMVLVDFGDALPSPER